MSTPLFMNGKQARDFLGLSRNSWYNLRRRGLEVPHWQDPDTGRKWYNPDALREWAKTHLAGAGLDGAA